MAITSAFTNIATTTRASKAWDPGAWDFVSGSAVGALVEYAANAPRITSSGLLVEEASINEIRNPRFEGATVGVIGSGGVAPTNMAIDGYGTTVEIVAVSSEGGWPYIDVKFSGTPTQDIDIKMEDTTTISAAQSEDWTLSVGLKLVAGHLTNITAVNVRMVERDAGSFKAAGSVAVTPDSTNKRSFFSRTLTHADTDAVQPYLTLDWDGSGAVDITLRIYAPQCENKADPTSPILPTVSSPLASTRNADDITVAAGSWLGSEHTIYADITPTSIGSFKYWLTLSDGTTSNTIAMGQASSFRSLMVAGGVTQVAAGAGPVAVGTAIKHAICVDANDVAISVNGQPQLYDTSVTVPTVTELQLGAYANASAQFPGLYIADFRYWPRRLTNAELEALVGN